MSNHNSIKDTGFFIRGKYKQYFEKDAVSKSGAPYKRRSLRVVYMPKGPDEDETKSTFISVPPGFELPPLTVGNVYTFSVDVNGGNDRAVYLTLNTHVPIQADA